MALLAGREPQVVEVPGALQLLVAVGQGRLTVHAEPLAPEAAGDGDARRGAPRGRGAVRWPDGGRALVALRGHGHWAMDRHRSEPCGVLGTARKLQRPLKAGCPVW